MTEFYTRAEYNKLSMKLKSRELTIERLRAEIKALKKALAEKNAQIANPQGT